MDVTRSGAPGWWLSMSIYPQVCGMVNLRGLRILLNFRVCPASQSRYLKPSLLVKRALRLKRESSQLRRAHDHGDRVTPYTICLPKARIIFSSALARPGGITLSFVPGKKSCICISAMKHKPCGASVVIEEA